MKKIRISISQDGSIEKAIKQLEEYRDKLEDKTKEFINALAEVGINALDARIASISPFYRVGGDGSEIQTSRGELHVEDGRWTCEIGMSGGQSIFVEFGAGVTFNTGIGGSKHPKGAELGYTIGSYNPSSKNASSKTGWWYVDNRESVKADKVVDGKRLVHTYGTPTFAPLYNTSEDLISSIYEVAKKVYG